VLAAIRDYAHIVKKSFMWHSADAAMRCVAGVYVSHFLLGNWAYVFLFLTVYWILFELLINIFLFGIKDPLYVGKTAIIDSTVRIISGLLNKDPKLIMVSLKTITLAICLICTFVL
jgi:hypothetical protein